MYTTFFPRYTAAARSNVIAERLIETILNTNAVLLILFNPFLNLYPPESGYRLYFIHSEKQALLGMLHDKKAKQPFADSSFRFYPSYLFKIRDRKAVLLV